MDPKLKKLMKELGEAINESLAESEQIGEVIQKIKSSGYDVFLVLEATVGFNRQDDAGEEGAPVGARTAQPEFKVSPQDLKFLRSLRIKVEDEAA